MQVQSFHQVPRHEQEPKLEVEYTTEEFQLQPDDTNRGYFKRHDSKKNDEAIIEL